MAEVTTGSLSGALPKIIAGARAVKENEGVWQRTCTVEKQQEGTGEDWNQYTIGQISAGDTTETTDNRNYQSYTGSVLTITPTMSQIVIKVTDRSARKLAKIVTSKFGPLAGNAMRRKKDEDYLALFASFATTCSPGTGNPLSSGHIFAAKNNITSNVTEPSNSQVSTVLHGFQIYDIQVELLAGVGTLIIDNGMTEEVFKKGFMGTVGGSNLFEDGNITVDTTPDANGATHSKEGVLAIISMTLKYKTDYDMYFGGGAEAISLVDEYGFGEQTSSGTQVWCYLHKSDATAPTS